MKEFRRKARAPLAFIIIGLGFLAVGLIISLGVTRPQIVLGNKTLSWPP